MVCLWSSLGGRQSLLRDVVVHLQLTSSLNFKKGSGLRSLADLSFSRFEVAVIFIRGANAKFFSPVSVLSDNKLNTSPTACFIAMHCRYSQLFYGHT